METLGIQSLLMLLVGFYLLIKGAGLLIEGASGLAQKIGLSDLTIALTVVAFGTSAPELGINVMSVFSNNLDLAVGNIIGSNITNLTLVLGIAGLGGAINMHGKTVWKEIPMLILISVLMLILASDHSLGDGWTPHFSLADGLTFLLFFFFFLGYIISGAIEDKGKVSAEGLVQPLPLWKAILWLISGIIALTIGGRWIVDVSSLIAETFNIAEGIIGLTIVALGTSLPELATSVVAIWRKKPDIAIGNLVGSNIFNIAWVLGITVLIRPVYINKYLLDDMYWMIGAGLILFVFTMLSRGATHTLKRWHSLLLLLFYLIFMFNLYLKL
jgi:cation:H+ antiporter